MQTTRPDKRRVFIPSNGKYGTLERFGTEQFEIRGEVSEFQYAIVWVDWIPPGRGRRNSLVFERSEVEIVG